MINPVRSLSKTFLLNCELVPIESAYPEDQLNMDELLLSSEDSQYIETIEISPQYIILQEKIDFIRQLSCQNDIKTILQNNFLDLAIISHILQFDPAQDQSQFFINYQQKIVEYLNSLPLQQLLSNFLIIHFLRLDIPFVLIAKGQIMSFFPELFNDFPLLRFYQRVVDFHLQFELELHRLLAKVQIHKQQVSAIMSGSSIRNSSTTNNTILALAQNTYQYFTSKFISKSQNAQIDVQVSFQIEKYLTQKNLIQPGQITVFFEDSRKEQINKFLATININNPELLILQINDMYLVEFSEVLQIMSRFDYHAKEKLQQYQDSIYQMISKFKKERPTIQQAYQFIKQVQKFITFREKVAMALLDKCYTKKYIADPEFYDQTLNDLTIKFVDVSILCFQHQYNKKNTEASVQVFIDELQSLKISEDLFLKLIIGLKKFAASIKKEQGKQILDVLVNYQ
ncbi:hypothetical protein SS50377_27045 [Spironucleus salmonicida]|uniref:Uncharacterized protein n=1 Tax=Spironucleus salmonicida TaxID=348837 RepID=V6LSH2_9EUKA|nr:hypothetical protein SS50377_27045 [Spironucleus salmonicida]|eukprot:EST47555.1 Hypothetical protein SS50377_12538 [Spironucleus salmonicida]